MAKLLITATHGYDNSTRAAMPFFDAKGASEAGIDVGLALALDATVLVKPELRKHVQPTTGSRRWRSSSSSWSITGYPFTSEAAEPGPGGSWTRTSSAFRACRPST